ncbi:MAG TPA: hypothetical protein VK824_11145, partial [Planctomycetota bacterium]|nr:hypothetical protein [Planctomycetota bacterium]
MIVSAARADVKERAPRYNPRAPLARLASCLALALAALVAPGAPGCTSMEAPRAVTSQAAPPSAASRAPRTSAAPHAWSPSALQPASQSVSRSASQSQPAPDPAPRAAPPAAGGSREVLCRALVTEPAGLARTREAATFGVPFARGVLRDVAALRCWRAKTGEPLPIQARAQSRWPDGSVRWALVDTQLALEARARVQLAVGRAADIAPTASTWTFTFGASDDAGASDAAAAPARTATIAGSDVGEAALLATSGSVTLGDGAMTWRLLERGPAGSAGEDRVAGLAPRLVDRFGHVYGGAIDPRSVQLLEQGPLRLTLLVRGEHRSLDGAGLPIAFHAFTARVSVLAGCARARVEWTLENGPLSDPPGALAFRSYELLPDPSEPPATAGMRCVVPTPAPRVTAPDVAVLFRQNGPTPERALLHLGDEELPVKTADDLWAGLLVDGPARDGAGAGAGAGEVDGNGGAERAGAANAANGDRAPVAATSPSTGALTGLFIHRVDSAHNHPAAFLRGPGGPLRIGLLPESKGHDHWLDDATQKTFRLDLARISGSGASDAGDTGDAGGAGGTSRTSTTAAVAAVAAAGATAMTEAAAPAVVALDPHDVAASLAWGDAGLMIAPDAAVAARADVYGPSDAPTGWTDWGEWNSRSTHTSGSPRNLLSAYLEFVQTGRAELFARAQARAFHAMDLRPFHIRGFLASEHPAANLYEGTPHVNEPPGNRLGRSGMDARFPEYKTGLPPEGHGYNGFDSEHMTLDDISECWLLTGDWVAHDALVSAGEAMLTWHTVQPGGDLWAARNIGWTLRALVQVFRATGERRYLDAAADMVKRADAERGHGAVKYLRKGAPDPRHIADAASEAPWMVAIAIHGLCAYFAETADPVVPPMVKDLVSFVMAGYRGDGWVSDLPTDGPLTGGKVWDKLGTSLWIPGALGAAAFVTGDHEPVDRTYPYYRSLCATPQHPAEFGSATWNWWQPYLLSLAVR